MGAAEESNRQEQSEQAKPRKRFSSTHTSVRGISLVNLVSDRGVFFPGQTDESPSLGIATGLPAERCTVLL